MSVVAELLLSYEFILHFYFFFTICAILTEKNNSDSNSLYRQQTFCNLLPV